MTIITIKLLSILTIFLYIKLTIGINDATVECQIGRSLRKQVKLSPLGGMCMKDIANHLSKALRQLGNNELGLTEYQETLDKFDFTHITNEPDLALNNLASNINKKLQNYINIIEESLTTITPIINDYKNYDKSKGIIDICEMIYVELYAKLSDNKLKNLHIIPLSLKQQMKICGPSETLHNIGLFIPQCNKPKNIIILIDHGSFMTDHDIALVRNTSKAIVNMLSDYDSITIIGLARHAFVHCKSGLIKSIDINKFKLFNCIDNIQRIIPKETFNIDLNELPKNLTDNNFIFHIIISLDDKTNVDKIKNIIEEKNIKVHLRTVLILLDDVNYDLDNHDDSMITIPSKNLLEYDIASLLSTIDCPMINKKNNYYLSDNYYDQFSKTVFLSIQNITDIALISLNIKLDELIQDVRYFNAGPHTRAILFNKKNHVLMHKNFPRIEMLQEQPLKVNLRDIENIDDADIAEMINNNEGNKKLINKLDKKITIKWKHLKYLDLISCIIIDDDADNKTRSVVKNLLPLDNDMYHHRLDLLTNDNKKNLCINHGTIMSPMNSVIYLSPWCFKSTTVGDFETSITLSNYMAYIKDTTELVANPGLSTTVRQEISILSQTMNFFKQRHSESPGNMFFIRRYVTSIENGIIELYPGVSLNSNLDPKRRLWFKKSIEYPGKIILTGPYIDAGGSGYVVTLSQTISEGRRVSLHTNNDPIIAISSIDMTIGYMSRLLNDMLPFCKETTIKCFLMDDRGYLVYHPSLIESGTTKFEQQHITHKELLVANDILNHDMFVEKKICSNNIDGTIKRYYKFNTSIDNVLTNIIHGEHCVKYQLSSVPGTNVFLGIINETCFENAFCPCSTMDRVCLNCKRMEQTECECPCECSLYNDNCEKTMTNYKLEPCQAPYEQGIQLSNSHINNGYTKTIDEQQQSSSFSSTIDTCPKIDCKLFDKEEDCNGIIGCVWCELDTDGETQLNTPVCTDESICYHGVLGSLLPYNDINYNSQSMNDITNNEWSSVGPIAGGILVVILIFGVTLFCYRLHSVQTDLEHQCLHLHGSPDTIRMTHIDNANNGGINGDQELIDNDRSKNNIDNLLLHDNIQPISPYRVTTNYRRPAGGDSDHGYSTMTPHDDTEQQSFAEPLLFVGDNSEPELGKKLIISTPVPTTTCLESPHHVLVPVTVHQNMEPNYC
ncbi:VWFA and cache domain-containing protein 1 [Aphidius gifuensis]|uniref:VWFA and cache domain-containing protein 1 n=1 Tax=Aphidius gifuensis TaxID=684658 RepID=UPI001CDD2539|nr:VWFA and cache domain-containing protein 1 [Aphidius gifuensis]